MSDLNVDLDAATDESEENISEVKHAADSTGVNNNANNLDNQFIEMSEDEKVEALKRITNENEKLKKDLKEKDEQSLDYLDRYRRTLADFENLRKRTQLEKQDSLRFANFNILSDLLPLLDDFQRALDHANSDKHTKLSDFIKGIEMIEKQFSDLLFNKYGVVRYGEPKDPFNPNIHSAMMVEEGPYAEETILDVFRKGYSLYDRVIRAAQVKVGKPKD